MSRNTAKSVAQISYGPKYSPESIFPDVTAAIIDAKALHSTVSSRCSYNQFWILWSHSPPLSHQPILDPKFVATSDVS